MRRNEFTLKLTRKIQVNLNLTFSKYFTNEKLIIVVNFESVVVNFENVVVNFENELQL